MLKTTLLAAIALTVASTSAEARDRDRHHRRDNAGAAFLGGFIGGLLGSQPREVIVVREEYPDYYRDRVRGDYYGGYSPFYPAYRERPVVVETPYGLQRCDYCYSPYPRRPRY